jgi:hypothetical protein
VEAAIVVNMLDQAAEASVTPVIETRYGMTVLPRSRVAGAARPLRFRSAGYQCQVLPRPCAGEITRVAPHCVSAKTLPTLRQQGVHTSGGVAGGSHGETRIRAAFGHWPPTWSAVGCA